MDPRFLIRSAPLADHPSPPTSARPSWPIEPPMSHDPPVARRQVEITNALGLHLRPADRFVRLASRFQAEVRVEADGRVINGKSILDLTTLAAECGTRLEIEARGPDAEAAVTALADLVAARFYEDENSDEYNASAGGPG